MAGIITELEIVKGKINLTAEKLTIDLTIRTKIIDGQPVDSAPTDEISIEVKEIVGRVEKFDKMVKIDLSPKRKLLEVKD